MSLFNILYLGGLDKRYKIKWSVSYSIVDRDGGYNEIYGIFDHYFTNWLYGFFGICAVGK